MIASLLVATIGLALLRLRSGDATLRLLGGVLVSVSAVLALVEMLATLYVRMFPH